MDPALHCGLAVRNPVQRAGVPQVIGSAAFSMTGTAINSDLALTGAIASVTRTGVGLFVFAFTSPLPDLNYFVVLNYYGLNVALTVAIAGYPTNPYTTNYLRTQFTLQYLQPNVAVYDPEFVRVLVFR